MRPSRLAAAATVVLVAGLLPGVTASSSGAPPPDPTYRSLSGFEPRGDKIRVEPKAYSAVRVNLGRVRAGLAGAPAERTGGGVEFAVPTPTGGTEKFSVTRTQVLAPELADAHPEIATYTGRSVSDPATTIALDVTPMGLHAAVRGPQGQDTWYVDPAYDRRGTTEHLAFYASATTSPEEEFVEREAPALRKTANRVGIAAKAGGPVVEKRYRLALTSDPSYAEYFGTDNVLAEKATLINRVNQIYSQDLAIRMLLINETDELNFDTEAEATGPDGPCGAAACYRTLVNPGDPPDEQYGDLDFCSGETLAQNRTVLGQVVGADNYDVGHIALGKNGGGVAYLGVVGADYKGGGCTGLPEPKGDFFAIDYVAHEIGHQFAGNHTFDGVQNACSGGNRNPGTSVEPGSGSSVMAYAGICLQDDLQPHTDPYFSFRTLDEVNAYTGRPTLPVVEVQTVSLRGFGAAGSTFDLSFGGASTTISADDYDAASIETAVEGITGEDVTISGWGYDPFGSFTDYPAPLTAPDATGFQVIFAPDADPYTAGNHQDVDPLDVTGGSAGVSGFVGETAKGGVADNRGISTAPTADRAPRVTKISKLRRIPARTPFVLTGKAADADGDPLTYLWEQTDRGLDAKGTSLVSNKKIYGPLFRVFGTAADVTDDGTLESPSPGINLAGRNGTRYFPDLAQVLAGNTNASTGRCPKVAPLPDDLDNYVPPRKKAIECYSEFLPTERYLGTQGKGRRDLHFRLTVRDGRGGVAYRNVTLEVAPSAGPFLVTSQKKSTTVRRGDTLPVRWQVNGTRKLAKRVTIYLSTNGGKTWKRELARTANDGSQRVRLPRGVRTKHARIVVAARGNYFYAVNKRDFRIR